MGWWWKKKVEETVKEVVDESLSEAVIKAADNRVLVDVTELVEVEKEPEPESVLAKYSIVPENYKTTITGESIGGDLLSAAKNYASSYFKWKEDISDLEALEKSLDEKYNRLSRLNLEKCQNGRELSEIRSQTRKKISDNEHCKERKELVEALYADVKSFTAILLSYKDFDDIRRKYDYYVGLVRDYGGYLTDQNITGLEEVIRFDKSVRLKESSFRSNNGIINILRSYSRDLTNLPKLEESLKEGRWPFAFVVEKKSYRWDPDKHSRILCVLEYESRWSEGHSRYIVPGQEIEEGKESDYDKGKIAEIKNLSVFKRIYKEYNIKTEDRSAEDIEKEVWEKVKLYPLAYDTILALYPNKKDSVDPVIVFQFYTDGVIVYGSIGKEDIFASLKDDLLNLSKKFYYQ